MLRTQGESYGLQQTLAKSAADIDWLFSKPKARLQDSEMFCETCSKACHENILSISPGATMA